MSEQTNYAGQTVRLKADAKHPQYPSFGGGIVRIEDTDRAVFGTSWMNMNSNPSALIYAMRSGFNGIPFGGTVYYGKHGNFGVLVHESEIAGVEPAATQGGSGQ